jgi:hypothetical protein
MVFPGVYFHESWGFIYIQTLITHIMFMPFRSVSLISEQLESETR